MYRFHASMACSHTLRGGGEEGGKGKDEVKDGDNIKGKYVEDEKANEDKSKDMRSLTLRYLRLLSISLLIGVGLVSTLFTSSCRPSSRYLGTVWHVWDSTGTIYVDMYSVHYRCTTGTIQVKFRYNLNTIH